jgi:hypothetical protein
MDIGFKVLPIFACAYLVNAIGGVFADIAPAIFEHVLIEQSEQVTKPVFRSFACLLRYGLQ